MKKIVQILLVAMIAFVANSNAQYTTGWSKAMNFGGAGSDIEDLRIVNGDTYFLARLMGKYTFAGNNYNAGSISSYPAQDLIFGKITAAGTQVLLNKYTSIDMEMLTGGARIGADGSLYVLRTGTGTSKNLGGTSTPLYGVHLLKVDPSGTTAWIKKLNQFTDVEFGSIIAPVPGIGGMQVKDNGDIYAIVKAHIPRGSVYPTRILKLNNSGDEQWNFEITAPTAGTSFDGILINNMPRQFVDDNGNVIFKAETTGNVLFNGESLPYEVPYVYAGYGNLKNWIIALDANGAKKWSNSAYISPTFYGVHPQSGEIYINYSYQKSPAAAPTMSTYSALPNLVANLPGVSTYAWSGIITFNANGSITKTKANNLSTITYPTQTIIGDGGRMLLYGAIGNGSVLSAGNNYINYDASGHGAMEIDGDFNPISVFRLPSATSIALSQNKFIVGGSFKTALTIGSTTLTPYFIDTDFNTRFPAWVSIKTDVLIAEGNLDQIPTELASTTWLGNNTNWNDASNWTNGVPTAETRVLFNATTANMPTVATTPKAGRVVIDAGIIVSLPTTLTVLDKIINNGKINVVLPSYSSFTGYGSKEISGTGELAFSGQNINYTTIVIANGTISTGTTSNSISFDNALTLGTIVNKLKFNGPNAKITGDAVVSSAAEDAVSGYSPTNFILGKLTRNVNATGNYFFPVGNYSEYAPVTIKANALSGTTAITAEISSGSAGTPAIAIGNTTIGSTLGDGFWKLIPNVKPTSGNYDVTFEKRVYTNGVIDANRYLTIKRDTIGTAWNFDGVLGESTQINATLTGPVAKNGIVTTTQTGLAKFGNFAIGTAGTALAPGLAVTSSTWTGNINTTWDNAGNWSAGVPDGTVDATIPAGLTNYPLVYTAAKTVRSLTIASGVTANLSNLITVNTTITNDGILEINSANNTNSGLPTVGTEINGAGKLVIRTGGRANSLGFSATGGNLGKLNNDLEINIGNANHINVLGSIGGNVTVTSGLVFARNEGSNWFNQTNATKTIQVTAPENHIAGRIYKTVAGNGTYHFPIGDDQWQRPTLPTGRKYGEISLTNNGISGVTQYQVWFDNYNTHAVTIVNGATTITSFINSGQWNVLPNAASATGTIDLSLKAAGFTNGRIDVNDYVLLRKNATGTWTVLSDATITETGGIITVTAIGIAPFGSNSTATKFCIGLKATTTTWTGNTNGNWGTASNWSNGVPNETIKAIIGAVAAGKTAAPTSGIPLNSGSGSPAAMEIASGVSLVLPTSFTTPLPIVNNGTIEVQGSGVFVGFGSGTYSVPSGTGTLKFTSNSPDQLYGGYISNSLIPNNIEINRAAGVTVYNSSLNLGGSLILTSGKVTVASGYTLSMTNPNATITGGSASSYITGNFNRAVNTAGTYNFPIGSASTYAPASLNLNNITGPQNITATFSNTAVVGNPNLSVAGTTINQVLGTGNWTITPNSALTGGNYNISLSAPIGSSTASQFMVIKRPDYSSSSAAWTSPGSNPASSVSAGIVTASANGISSFSQFALGELPVVLPIQLVKFNAKAEQQTSLLYWETATELNNDKFVIERSEDGKTFVNIGEVKGKGNSSALLSYSFRDKNPLNGANYYRLKQVDLDGKSNYSPLAAVNFTLNVVGIKTYPNPVTNVLYFSGTDAKPGTATLYNLMGQKVQSGAITNDQIAIHNTLTDGFYLVVATFEDNSVYRQKILIKK